MGEQKELIDYGFSSLENYGDDYVEVSAFCEECSAELDSEERQEAANTGYAMCTKCFFDETEEGESLPSRFPSWEDQIMPGTPRLDRAIPGVRVINLKDLKPKTESEKTLLRGTYRPTHWKMRILSGAAQQMLIHGDFKFPNETGGLCFGPVGRRLITHITWLKNLSKHPTGLFEPDGQVWFNQLQNMKERGLEWKAWWHSHPGFQPLPSGIDTTWHKHNVHMVICNPKSGEIRSYDWDKQNPTELREVRMEVKQ